MNGLNFPSISVSGFPHPPALADLSPGVRAIPLKTRISFPFTSFLSLSFLPFFVPQPIPPYSFFVTPFSHRYVLEELGVGTSHLPPFFGLCGQARCPCAPQAVATPIFLANAQFPLKLVPHLSSVQRQGFLIASNVSFFFPFLTQVRPPSSPPSKPPCSPPYFRSMVWRHATLPSHC